MKNQKKKVKTKFLVEIWHGYRSGPPNTSKNLVIFKCYAKNRAKATIKALKNNLDKEIVAIRVQNLHRIKP